MITWREALTTALKACGETWEQVESNTLSDDEMDVLFDAGYGGSEGKPFTVWTSRSVYFPVVYDGAEWVGRVARHPDGQPTAHQGGE